MKVSTTDSLNTKLPVLLIDDHPLINRGLTSFLEETGRFAVMGQINSLAEAKCFFEEKMAEKSELPYLIILDIMLGEENGLDFFPFLDNFCKKKKISRPPVLICSVLDDPFRIQTALKLGASGYILKTGNMNDLLCAIDTVLNGKKYIAGIHNIKLNEASDKYSYFTKRELEVLDLIKQNKTNQQIAKAMCLSIRTVENHVSNIYIKTGKENRLELIKL
ncbi:MAG: response regulator transcription factor [Treponema sp.]|nr:response regulator transcription factor [Treponema sp.]